MAASAAHASLIGFAPASGYTPTMFGAHTP
jgi:hypothetical protein